MNASPATASDGSHNIQAQRHAEYPNERVVWFWLLASAAFHLFLIFRFPLAPDETYYWEWSRHLDLGYYDQGPMIAWWIRASCEIFGDTPLGVRFPIVLACSLTQFFVYRLGRDLFGIRVGFVGLVVSTITPLALAGSFIATYDPLVVLFWTAAAHFTARAVFASDQRAWIWAGIAFGLGLLSKHTMSLFPPAMALFLAVSPKHRIWLKRPQPYLALAIGVLVFAPNLWWQSQHEWITFRHLFLLTGKGVDQSFLRRLGDFFGSQAGLLTPPLFFAMIAAMFWAAKRAKSSQHDREWYFCSLSAPVLTLFLLMTAKSKVQANWAVCGWVTAPLLWAAWLERRSFQTETRTLFGGTYTRVALGVCAALSLILVWPESLSLVGVRIPPKLDQMNKLYGGVELGAALEANKREMQARHPGPVTVGATTYDVASRIGFYMPEQPNPVCFFLGTRENSFSLWQKDYRPVPGGNVLIADDRPPDDPELCPFDTIFEHVEPVDEPVLVWRTNSTREPIHRYYLYRCFGYKPNPLTERPKGG